MALNNLVLENVRIGFRNFSGEEGKFNRAGDRNFVIFLDDELAGQMQNDGWNVKFLKPRDEDEDPQAYLPVKVNFKNRPPKVMLVTRKGKTALNEQMVGILDWVEFTNVDLIINPYEWNVNGKTGVTAYLKSMFATMYEDDLDIKYEDVPDSAAGALSGRQMQALESADIIDAEEV